MRFLIMYAINIGCTIGYILTLDTFEWFYTRMNNQMFYSLITTLKLFITMRTLQIPWLVMATKMKLVVAHGSKPFSTGLTDGNLFITVVLSKMNFQLSPSRALFSTFRANHFFFGTMMK